MQIDIVNGNYKDDYLRANVSECINYYVVYGTKTEGNKVPKYLKPTPGLVEYCDLGTGAPIDDLNLIRNTIYAVSDSKLFKIESGGIVTQLQELDASLAGSDPLYIIEAFSNQIGIISKNIAYSYDYVQDTLTKITDVDYPGLINATTLNGYLIGTNNTTNFYFSELNDITNWQGDQVIAPNTKNDKTLRVEEFRENLYCFGEESLEIYRNTGSQAVFERLTGTSSPVGLLAPDSVAKYNEGIIFLGHCQDRSPVVYLINQYDAVPISPSSITSQINDYDNLHLSKGFIESTTDGHILYHLSIPSAKRTWVYNSLTQEWHIRRSRVPTPNPANNVEYDVFRGINPVYFDNKVIYGDRFSSKLLYADKNVGTEDGEIIQRLWRTKVFTDEAKNISVGSLTLDCNVGVGVLGPTNQGYDPQLMFRVSKTNGKTWSNERWIPLGRRGQYGHKAFMTRLGTGKHWTLEFKITDPVMVSVMSAYIRGSIGGKN